MTSPRATARLIFHKGFPIDSAVPLVDYFAELGVSHLCASPLLAARPGLLDGAGVVAHDAIAPEIGGEMALKRLVHALRRRQMGLLVEIAPGHMAVGGADNPVWLDVLEWGRDSAFASWFDIDWRAGESGLRHKVLAPFLDRPYGEALADGVLALGFDGTRGAFRARHFEHAFPISPLDYPLILDAAASAATAAMRTPFAGLSRLRPDPEMVRAAKYRLATLAATVEGRAAIAATLDAFDPRREDGRALLHKLLERQAYRLAWRRAADDDLNWRRHPATTDAAGIKVERADVFDATHALLFRLYGEGVIDGFRIVGWDQLADPAAYSRRLRLKLGALARTRPKGAPAGAPIFVEKVLGPGEPLPFFWDVSGTTGGEAAEAIGAVLHDPAAASALSGVWTSTSGDRQRYDDKWESTRRETVRGRFGTELQAVARALHDVAQGDLSTRDLTFAAIKRVVLQLAVAFPEPRTYADINGHGEWDARVFHTALERARRRLSPEDLPVADHIAAWLGGEAPRNVRDFEQSGAREHAIAKFQQFTAALDAEAVGGSLLYRYGRLLSRNDWGSDPTLLGLRPATFHERMAARAGQGLNALTATAGPPFKRGEDARMRLAVLSEIPQEWEDLIRRLGQITAPFRSRLVDGAAPEPADEIMLYQSLVSTWPHALRADDTLGFAELKERTQLWLREAIRAAGVRTRRSLGNPDYEAGCAEFLTTLLEAPAGAPARQLFVDFIARIAKASAVNALAHCLLKHTIPGVPEIYQGCEFWDRSFEAPDNRRAVDFIARDHALAAAGSPERLLETFPDGRVKQAAIARLLASRRAHPALYAQGSYEPLVVQGPRETHALAFMRRHHGETLIAVVTRLSFRLLGTEATTPKVPTLRWGDTGIVLPADVSGPFIDAITGREVHSRLGRIDLSDALLTFPGAVLVKT